MNYRNLIEETKSTRDFKGSKVPKNVIQDLQQFSEKTMSILQDQNIEMVYLEDGEKVYQSLQGIGGFNGIMISAPQYILFLSENKENHPLNVGYYVQQLILKLQELEVDTCWITIPEDGEIVKQALNIQNDKEAATIIALGYDNNEIKVVNQFHFGENYSKTDIKVVENNVSTRLSMDQVVYLDKWDNPVSVELLNSMGLDDIFHYVVLAPTTFNRQPWRFILKGDHLYLAIRRDPGINDELNLLDAGIVMFYMEIIMKEFNISGKWHIETKTVLEEIPDNYKYIGFFSKEK